MEWLFPSSSLAASQEAQPGWERQMQNTIALSEASRKQPSITNFTDPEAYQAAINPAQVELLVTTKGQYRAGLAGIELHGLSLQRGHESLPRVANATVRADRSALFFLASAHQPPTHHSGRALAFGEIVASAAGSTHHLRTEGPCHWATFSMTRDDLATAGHALVGRDLIDRSVTRYIRPSLPEISCLLNLHQASIRLAESAPQILAQPETAQALKHALVHAMVMCLGKSTPVSTAWGALRHAAIIARFEEMLAANYNRPLHLAEICAAIGASERTLRVSCMEHLGMGPIRYLWLRRMHLARRALILADATTSTVTRVATENGFWELGRFAVDYRTLFGESPSVSLRRPAEEMRKSKNSPFAFADSEYA
jgi:AraC-like DNA-binding protein